MSSRQKANPLNSPLIPSEGRIQPKKGFVTFAEVSDTPSSDDIVLDSVSAARSSWLSTLFEKSVPWFLDATRSVAARHYPKAITNRRDGILSLILQEYGVTALAGNYSDSHEYSHPGAFAYAAAELLIHVGDEPRHNWAEIFDCRGITCSPLQTLTTLGYGQDEFGSSFEDIKRGPAALVALCDEQPRVWLKLKTDSWLSTRRSQRDDTLRAIECLANGYEVKLVASPEVQQKITTRHHEWFGDLTQINGPSDNNMVSAGVATDDASPQELYDTLRQIPPGGRLRILAALPDKKGESRTLNSLKQDSDINLSSGAVNRYYRELEELGLIAVSETLESNEVRLTANGRNAQHLLTTQGKLSHPLQQKLTATPTHPPQSDTGIVCGDGVPESYSVDQSFEEALSANGGVLTVPKPQELPLPQCWLDEPDQFHRLAASQLADGLTLADEKINNFEDGRIAYLGEYNDEVHVVTQWGGGLVTTVRLAATLLSELAFDTILTKTRLDSVLDGPMASDLLRLGRQLGWLSNTTYSTLKVNYGTIARSLLSTLTQAKGDPDVWAKTARNAHGLLATATSLYDAADYSLYIHIRIPDTNQLQRDQERYQNFLDFLQATVPKSAVYRGNSAARHLLETDGDKLKYRLPIQIDPTDRRARLTANWIISGPHVSDFRADITSTLETTPIRKQLANGTQTGIEIPIDIATTDTPHALVQVIENTLERTGRTLASDVDTVSLARVYLHALSDPAKDRIPSPATVAEALLATNKLVPENQPLKIDDIMRGLGWVHHDRIYPWLAPSARHMMAALFRTDSAMRRQDILESAAISDSSYERHRQTLDSLGLLTDVGNYHYESMIPGAWTQISSEKRFDNRCQSTLEQYRLAEWVEDVLQVLRHHPLNSPNTVCIG